jgi:hypothetical protein
VEGRRLKEKKRGSPAYAALLLFRRTLFLALFAAADVATPIPHFVSFEVRNLIDMLWRLWLISDVWWRALIAVVWVIMVVNVALEVVWSMKPWACANEGSASKPLRTVISVGCATVRSSVIVTIWAVRGGSDVHREADLGVYLGSAYREAVSGDRS